MIRLQGTVLVLQLKGNQALRLEIFQSFVPVESFSRRETDQSVSPTHYGRMFVVIFVRR
jgi:hypothetical protein